LGQGSFAVVKLATKIATGQKYAIKIYDIQKNSAEELKKNLMNEIHLLLHLDHPNIIKLHDWFEGQWFIYLVLEYVGPVSLMEYLEKQPSSQISEEEAAHVFYELAKGIQYLHEQTIFHRDLKLNNILLGSQAEVKLIDFGFSIRLKELKKISAFCGTPSYMSPEILSKQPYLPDKGDSWSFGVCLYRALTGNFPFRGSCEIDPRHQSGQPLPYDQERRCFSATDPLARRPKPPQIPPFQETSGSAQFSRSI
jgi:serine/threonine protein kinase